MNDKSIARTPIVSNQVPLIPRPFEHIKHTDDNGIDYWDARELMDDLEYDDWRNFGKVIAKAKAGCIASGSRVEDHFVEANTMIAIGKGGQRKAPSYKLSRYACYFVAMESDSSKTIVAEAKTYFMIQTRRQEIADEQRALNEQRDRTAYQLKGKPADWARERVESKASQKGLNAVLQQTHIDHKPDYAAIGGIQNKGIFDMTKAGIVTYLGLLPKDEDKYRDHLGEYAIRALKEVNRASELRIKKLGHDLTTNEQEAIVRAVIQIIAPTMQKLAEFVGQDFISGVSLNDKGVPMLEKHVKLLK